MLRRALIGQSRGVAQASVMVAAHQTGEALVPVIIGVVIDKAITSGGTPVLIGWLAVLAADFAFLSFGYRFGARAAERAGERSAHEIRVALAGRVLEPGGGAEIGHRSGALTNVATGDARRVGAFVGALPFGVAALTGILVTAVALLLISIPLGLLVLLGTPPMLWLAQVVGRPLQRRSEAEQEKAAQASGIAADLVVGLRILKGLGAEPVAVSRYRQISQDSLHATLRAARAGAWHDGALLACTGLFLAAIALLGGRLAADGRISVGDLIAAVGLAQFLLGPLSTFTWVNGELAQARGSAVRVAAILAAPPAVTSGTGQLAIPVRGQLHLRAVTHGVFNGLDLEVAAGELLGVVMDDPIAATTLLDLLGRTVDPDAGILEVDGVAFTDLDLTALRAEVLVDAHDAVLFEDSLAVVDDVFEVAETLPQGRDTVLTERGRSLSGGQRQRVALARALGAETAVLVVHDPTTAVDAVTEAFVADQVRRIRTGRTTILVTTSPVLLAVADRVVVIEDGAIVAEGSHVDLVHTRQSYRTTVLA